MNSELKRKGIISIIIHAAVIIFLITRSFISCHRINTRNISPFIDLQMGASAMPQGGGAGTVKPVAIKEDDAFPEPAKKSKGQVEISRKLVKHSTKTAPKKQLSGKEIKRMLGEGVASSVSPLPGTGSGAGPGGGGTPLPYAWYYNQVKSAMYEAWQQPSSLIGTKGLVTTVEIRVQRAGRITAKKITAPSGNTQMDDSVLRALEAVTRLPELPAGLGGLYKDIIIDFELTGMALSADE
ncbi:MAG: energy transducer TonB [Kiritimatiellia bacterium]|nr:energy transducer TonB [Kiritimatiellia bacterium]